VFDIGNPNLKPEQGTASTLRCVNHSERLRIESGVYYYNLSNYVYTAFTDAIDPSSHLPIR